jgi:hypothetical protein
MKKNKPTEPERHRVVKAIKSFSALVRGSLRRMVLRIWWGLVKRDCWKCAHRLIALGQENGSAQEHIDAAKDALYRAARAAEAEGSGVDAQNAASERHPLAEALKPQENQAP